MDFFLTTTITPFVKKFRERYKYKIPAVNFDEILNVGDYVTLNRDSTFNKEGAINSREGMNIPFSTSPPEAQSWDIQVNGSKGCKLFAQGESPVEGITEASVEISFDSNHSFYYKAQALRIERMKDPILTLENDILYRFHHGGRDGVPKWDKAFAVVTAVIIGKNIELIESTAGQTTVWLSCKSDFPVDGHPFNDMGAHLEIISSSNGNCRLKSNEQEVAIAYVMHQLKGFPKKKVRAMKGVSQKDIFDLPDMGYQLVEI
ncbi:MAG: hypothetical protein LBQ39_03440 [Tannerellaceae bacterium]|jgi:hypothetical protein|nr:hypothetical protein [Tannerellaceae bacterium]